MDNRAYIDNRFKMDIRANIDIRVNMDKIAKIYNRATMDNGTNGD